MGLSTRTLIVVLCIAITSTLGFLAYILTKEFQKSLPSELNQSAPKSKTAFEGSEFLKVGQTPEATFILSDARTVSHKEMNCLAQNIYYEARGESILGMVGIAQITLNRADSKHRGKSTLCGVVHDDRQFSWANGSAKPRRLDKVSWQHSLHIAQLVLLGVRIRELDDAIYFHSRKIKQPKWSRDLPVNKTIGKHIYFGAVNG